MADRAQSKGLGVARLTVSTTPVALPNIPAQATFALIRAKTAAVCFTDDGVTTPTATVGLEILVGETLNCDSNLTLFKAVRRDATDATLLISYYAVA